MCSDVHAESQVQKPLLFATVGTDHHPFDRLVRWVDAWLAAGGDGKVRSLVQVGTSAAPKYTGSTDYLDHESMQEAMRDAALVVCHGGPGTIMLAAAAGTRPIVIPRERSLGEHVDDHQVAFTQRMLEDGTIHLAKTQEELHALLDQALDKPEAARRAIRESTVGEAVARFEALVDPLVMTQGHLRSEGPVRVLYIAGMGRSGSTLLDLMLGQIPDLVPVGELRFIWKRGLAQNQLCGCGERFWDCPFWTAVGQEAFGGWENVDVEEVIELEQSVDRHRFVPFLLFPNLWPDYSWRLRRYANILSRLYRGIERAGPGKVVVDSTKDPPFAFLLHRVPGLDLRVVHLVRDARGVAYSWTKKVRKPEQLDKVELMDIYSPAGMGLRWLVYNLFVHVLERFNVPRLLVRYESLVTSPSDELQRVVEAAGQTLGPDDLSFLDSETVELGVHHTVAGNPMRFSHGRIPLRVDEEWKTKLEKSQQWLISLLTWPLMWRYGYLRRRLPKR